MYFKIDREQCIACGLCQLCAKQLISYDEEGIASIIKDQNLGKKDYQADENTLLTTAAKRCPVGAIQHSNKPFSDL
ncbi:ferredoxin [Atopobacter sp. AH10]|uniref:ferredoxin n=1 Tax=Atopobacter sp. AH10 TaxID=2315861 RepID=UPI000EF23217|nr:ferredoxin [Atopobacter sp. AH10]RLK63215.1 ferredoxin [Atopobacter sp. AH10]